MTDRIPAAPRGCGAAGRKLWRSVIAEYELEQHEMALLERACRVADTCADLQAVVDREGVMSANRFGDSIAHPALVELRQESIVLARLIVALRVPLGEEDATSKNSPRAQVRSIRGVHGLSVAR